MRGFLSPEEKTLMDGATSLRLKPREKKATTKLGQTHQTTSWLFQWELQRDRQKMWLCYWVVFKADTRGM